MRTAAQTTQATTRAVTVSGPAEVRAVLADPAFTVPPAPEGGPPGGIGWLRASVARFSEGEAHGQRRSLATAPLAEVDPAVLRRRAFERTAAVLRAADGQPVDLMASVARVVPVEVLAEALGIAGAPAGAVATVASAYRPHADAGPAADRAVARLVDACGGVTDEATAARIGLLVQACDATAGLIGNVALAMLRQGPGRRGPVEAILADTLRRDPPVRATSRVATAAARVGGADIPAGEVVRLDLAAADRDPAASPDPGRFACDGFLSDGSGVDRAGPGREGSSHHLTFGYGRHACPGRDHALAIVAGIVEAVRGCRLVSEDIAYEPSPNLRCRPGCR